MPVPRSIEARRYYNVALQRLEDGRLILERLQRAPAATYLAGYAVECILKALMLSHIPAGRHREFVASEFRGPRAHDIGWLRARLRELRTPNFPAEISRDLTFLSTWSVDLRYTPGLGNVDEAEEFLNAAERVVKFVVGRLS